MRLRFITAPLILFGLAVLLHILPLSAQDTLKNDSYWGDGKCASVLTAMGYDPDTPVKLTVKFNDQLIGEVTITEFNVLRLSLGTGVRQYTIYMTYNQVDESKFAYDISLKCDPDPQTQTYFEWLAAQVPADAHYWYASAAYYESLYDSWLQQNIRWGLTYDEAVAATRASLLADVHNLQEHYEYFLGPNAQNLQATVAVIEAQMTLTASYVTPSLPQAQIEANSYSAATPTSITWPEVTVTDVPAVETTSEATPVSTSEASL